MSPAGGGVPELSRSFWPQYMQNTGGPWASSVDRVRRQRGQVTCITGSRRAGCGIAAGGRVLTRYYPAKGCSLRAKGDYRLRREKHKPRRGNERLTVPLQCRKTRQG